MGNPTKRSSLLSWSGGSIWFVSLLLITGSFCLTLVQLSKGLHDQLLATRSKLHDCRKQLVQIGVEKETLLEHQREERTRVAKLRDKSALVSKELLEQNKRVRLLQFEFLAAREDLKLMTFNCTESSRLMEKQFGVTMRFLMDRVINNREYHILLNKHLKDRVKLERSLELMQNKVYNLTEKLSLAKTSLFVAGKSIAKAKK
mmetsp:Transcript_12328/g.26420  ORF Transcript_12328/g.26420 Transcript_12328/m.26420 type:complete len:202 (-) Transcript_12328:810-1415(-)